MIAYYVLAAIGGGLGAVCRYFVTQRMSKRFSSALPYGTLAVNLTGSFLLGLFLSFPLSNVLGILLGAGLLGGFTTFSTLAVECVQYIRARRIAYFMIYLGLSLCGGILFAAAGFWTGLHF